MDPRVLAACPRTLLLACLAVSPACTSSMPAPKSPDAPDAPNATGTENAPDAGAPSDNAPPNAPAQQLAGTAVAGSDQGSIPDDYYITGSDCNALGNQYSQALRNDQVATLSPKLTDKRRAEGMATIDKAVATLEDKWIAQCNTSLVGKVGDPKALKCALNAQTVKTFDVCLNGESASSVKGSRASGKKSE